MKHPYHTLPIVLALAHSNMDERVQTSTKKPNLDEDNDRTKAAKNIIAKLKNKSPELAGITTKTESMSVGKILTRHY